MEEAEETVGRVFILYLVELLVDDGGEKKTEPLMNEPGLKK